MLNKSRAISLRVTVLTSLKDKLVGLIGKNPIYPISFTTRWGIHTFGVVEPIDVLILDHDRRVVLLINSLPPNRFFFWNPEYVRVIELPAGYIRRKHITIGDRLSVSTSQ